MKIREKAPIRYGRDGDSSEARLRGLVESCPTGFVVLDHQGRFTFMNDEAESWSGPREEVLGRSYAEVFPNARGSGFEAAFDRVLEGGDPESFERYRGSDGHWYLLDLIPLEHGVGIHFRNVDAAVEAEERWKTAAERLQVAMEASRQGGYEFDVESGRVEVTSTYWSIYDEPADRGAMTVDEWRERIHPDDRERILAGMEAALEGSEDWFANDYRLRMADGSYGWISDHGRVTERDETGRARRIVGVIRDVTERKRAEVALRRSEEEHRRLFETMAQGVVYQDASGEIVRANPAAEEILGLTVDQMRGRTSKDPHWRAIREDGSDFPGEEHPSTIALRTGREVDGVVMGVHNPEGDRVRWILVHARPLFHDGEDGPHQVYTTFTDITVQREIQEDLHASEARYRALVENSPDILARYDRDARMVYLSPSAERYGLTDLASLLDLRPTDLDMYREQMAIWEQMVRGVLADGRPRTESFLFTGEEGSRYFDARFFPEFGEDGRVAAVVAIAQDVTEKKRLEAQFREAQKMEAIGQLAGGVAHDFNNLLTVMRGHAELALGSLADGDPIREDLEEVVRASDRASSLTRQLLAFGRRQVMEAKIVDLGEVVAGMEKMLRRLIGEHIGLEVSVEPRLRPVRVDPGQMEQVVMNLAVNARDAVNGDGGTIRIRVRCGRSGEHEGDGHRQWVCVDVEDDGAGMDERTAERVFEPFFTTKREGKGTGLGLSTVYGIVRQSRGWIDVESDPGVGSVFTVGIPAVEGPVDDRAGKDDAEAAGSTGIGRTVLVVEDEEAVRRLARRVLERMGYRVLVAADSGEAIGTLEEADGAVDLLLTDVVMPGMNGKELVGRVRERFPEVRILLMSGYDAEAVESGGLDLPGRLLRKPFSPEDLGRVIAEVLETDPD